jgi:hypothetical protein
MFLRGTKQHSRQLWYRHQQQQQRPQQQQQQQRPQQQQPQQQQQHLWRICLWQRRLQW